MSKLKKLLIALMVIAQAVSLMTFGASAHDFDDLDDLDIDFDVTDDDDDDDDDPDPTDPSEDQGNPPVIEEDIEDGQVPLDPLPHTGDAVSAFSALTAVLSGSGILGLVLDKKKKEE